MNKLDDALEGGAYSDIAKPDVLKPEPAPAAAPEPAPAPARKPPASEPYTFRIRADLKDALMRYTGNWQGKTADKLSPAFVLNEALREYLRKVDGGADRPADAADAPDKA